MTGSILCTIVLLLSGPLLRIYNRDPAVVAAGTERLFIVATLYIVFGAADVFTGAIRGCGSPVVPVICNLLCTCVFRLIWVAAINTDTMSVRWVYASYPLSWLFLLIVLLFCWHRLYRKRILPSIPSIDKG